MRHVFFLGWGVDPDRIVRPADAGDFLGNTDEFGDGLFELGRFQQVQGGEFAAEPGQRAEQLQVPAQRQAREIDLQKLRVAAPVAGTVQHRVGIVEDVFGRQAGGQAVLAHAKIEFRAQRREKTVTKVQLAVFE